jgi:hypothetical protein
VAECYFGPVAKFRADEGDATIVLMSDGRVLLSHPGLEKSIELAKSGQWVGAVRQLKLVPEANEGPSDE